MTSMNPNITDMPIAVRDALRAHWKLCLFQGVVMVILGIVAVAAPPLATVAVDIYVGWLFMIGGIVGLLAMFSASSVPAFLWTLVTALLSLAAGVMLVWKPVEGAYSLTFVLAAFFVAEGIFQTVASFTYRDAIPSSWGWMLLSGLSDLLLAGIIIWDWPTSAEWALGLIVGINLITTGIALAMAALAGRNGG